MHRQLRLLQIAIGDVILDQLADAVMGDQEIAAPQKAQHGPPAHRKDVVPLQSAPDRQRAAARHRAWDRRHRTRRSARRRWSRPPCRRRCRGRRANAACRPGWRRNCRRRQTQRRFSTGPISSRTDTHTLPQSPRRHRPRGVVDGYSSGGTGWATGAAVIPGWSAGPDPESRDSPGAQLRTIVRCSASPRNDNDDLSARRTPSRSRNGRACCGCLRGSRRIRTSPSALPACPGCRTS